MPPLPRKFSEYSKASEALGRAKVHPVCVELWHANRAGARGDTFIGMTDTRDWTFYLAPCFGVSRADQATIEAALKAAHGDDKIRYNADVVTKYAKADLPASVTHVTVASTATGGTARIPLSDLVRDYGRGNIVLVQLTEDTDKGFDGKSHAALTAWVARHERIQLPDGGSSGLKANSLGFAIQKDSSGYYIRFSSSLNEIWGQGQLTRTGTVVDRGPTKNTARTFEHRPLGPTMDSADDIKRLGYEATRERRDLPKEWAQFFELILARDLKLALINAGAKHDRIVSRGISGESSKMRRFNATNPDSHLDLRHPGTAGTGHRMV